MPKIVKLEEANDGKHKWIATFDTGKHTRFGAIGYPDYTTTHDEERKEAYKKRHHKDLSTGDPTRAGFVAMFILWNKPTIAASLKDYNKRFG